MNYPFGQKLSFKLCRHALVCVAIVLSGCTYFRPAQKIVTEDPQSYEVQRQQDPNTRANVRWPWPQGRWFNSSDAVPPVEW